MIHIGKQLNVSVARCGVLVLAGFAIASWALTTLDVTEGQRVERFPELADTGSDTYFVLKTGQELSHPVYYYDLGRSIENARQADILLVGNSRTQLGFDETYLTEQANRLGLRVFNLAFGHGDGIPWALDLIRRHDLRPRLVIANGGPFIFYRDYSDWAQEVIDMGPWEARKTVWELTAAFRFQALVHRYLPRVSWFGDVLTTGWVHYRSERSGWWRNALEPPWTYDITVLEDQRSEDQRALGLAQEFKRELDARGAMLVLTTVPYFRTHTAHLPWLSAELGVPWVLPSFDGVQTADGSHLTPDSRRRITRDIWPALMALPEVQAALRQGGQ